MKNKIKKLTFALLTAILLYGFAIGSQNIIEWLIPWELLEIVSWITVYFGTLTYVMMNFNRWYDNYLS